MLNRHYGFVLATATALVLGSNAALACFGCNSGGHPAPSPLTGFTIDATAGFEGFGAGAFDGGKGFVKIEKGGYSGVDLTADGSGSPCGLKCVNTAITFDAYAGEHVSVRGAVVGHQPGRTVSMVNSGSAAAFIDFNIEKKD